jgi:hypothetical protein
VKITFKKPKTRRSWKMNPRTRVKEDDKDYHRPQAKAQVRKMLAKESEERP